MPRTKTKLTHAAQNRKAEIIEIATRLFAEQGYHSTSLNDVAAILGVTKATLYYYFRSKEEILKAILEKCKSRMDQVLVLQKSPLSAKEKLRQFIHYHILFGSDNFDLAKIIFEQTVAIPLKMRTSLMRKEKKIDNLLQHILKQGLVDQSLAIKDIKVTSYAILGMCTWTYHWYKLDGRFSLAQIAEQYINLLEKGLLPEPPDNIS